MRPFATARGPRRWLYDRSRRRLARQVIAGSGIEIGALNSPFPVPPAARVRYLDRLTTEQLRIEYPELGGEPLVPVDLVDDGEALTKLEKRSQDFVIASHFLEHCEDPIGTLEAHLRVLRPGGTLLLALPDRRRGIDRHREPTSLAHLIADHECGPETSREEHYREWARLVDLPLGNVRAGLVEVHASSMRQRGYRIHFHCWTPDEFAGQLRQLIERYELPGAFVQQRRNQHEFLLALRRT